MSARIRQFHVKNCKLEDLQRLCKYLHIDPSTDNERSSLINWLVYMGYVEPEYNIGRMY